MKLGRSIALFPVMILALNAPVGGLRAEDAVDLTAAAKQFVTSCGVCHTVEPGAEIRQGPNLHAVVGRKAGTLAEFSAYSDALKKAGDGGLVWNAETLDKWISNAAIYIPGSMMLYSQADPAKRALIIAYLNSLSPPGGDKPTEDKPTK